MSEDYEYDAAVETCSDCAGKSYGWTRCATCEVRRCMADVEPQPVENVAGTLFEEAS